MCAIADKTAIAPKRAPTSDPYPQAWIQTAPKEWSAGFPPDVKEDRVESPMKVAWDLVDVMATSESASPSTPSDA